MNIKYFSKIVFSTGLTLSLLSLSSVSGYAADINGTNSADTLYGTSEADNISAFQGNDSINGLEGSDNLYGGGDNDYINGGANNDNIYGDNNNDTLFGGTGSDNILGGEGNDYVIGDENISDDFGNDFLIGNEGQDVIFGQGGEDQMHGGQGYDLMIGGESADRIYGDRDGAVIWGENGDDQIYIVPTTGKSGTFNAGIGNSTVSIGDVGYSAVISGNGYDTITLESREVMSNSRLDIFNTGTEEDTVYFAPEYSVAPDGVNCNRLNSNNVMVYSTCSFVSFVGNNGVRYTRLILNSGSSTNITAWLAGNIKYATGNALNSGTLTYSNNAQNIEIPTMYGGGNGIPTPNLVNIIQS